jgi:bifunctional UDP-N-acetylglucosamine pyrophosphorylase/glucosamine-1-phosphate N-acetyltransferase
VEAAVLSESLILAAGLGTRMKSDLPKTLHLLGGRPMVAWSIDACKDASGRPPYVVVGPETDVYRQAVDDEVALIVQEERLGTGHAVMQAAEDLRGKSDLVLVVHADMPLLRSETLRELIEAQSKHEGVLSLLAMHGESPRGFGRILRDDQGKITGIMEEAHASPAQLAIRELNIGAYCYRADWLWESLPKLEKSPKGEYYLTDLVGLAVEQSSSIGCIHVTDQDEVIGINTREHLSEAETALRRRINRHWMAQGISVMDVATTYISHEARIGVDTVLLPNTHLEGATVIGEGCRLGPNSIIRESTIGDRCHVEASVVEEAVLEDDVHVGPFSHLRRGTHLCNGVHVGNFGEVKNSKLGPGAKMGHFSYIGDATVGSEANIGAGTITCNYDGEKKHHTEIGERAFIGSDTMLVAPVRVGKGARTGAGAVVNKDVPDYCIAVGVPARVVRKLKADDE